MRAACVRDLYHGTMDSKNHFAEEAEPVEVLDGDRSLFFFVQQQIGFLCSNTPVNSEIRSILEF